MRKTDSSVGTDIESGKCYYTRPSAILRCDEEHEAF